ncbi:hypothetical protein ACG83_12670 [Frankia sp. R43]|uniref:hypothetical protein n=1 Tax=Frankia sp. R43 TaxID=269536 RepID=UPI0006CA5E2D|nr:hypothetical protein [Frankia sp. R43]KPM56022.1 hypothetical protein ACG83_12670 [Frankia sp. R43]
MSPVSRGRKPKKSRKRPAGRPGSGQRSGAGGQRADPDWPTVLAHLRSRLRRGEEPTWFQPAIEEILDDAGVVLSADGPRALEETTSTMLGRQLRLAVRDELGGKFDWWLLEVIAALAEHARGELEAGSDGWEAPWRLLYGIASVAVPPLAFGATSALRSLVPHLLGVAPELSWLDALLEIAATGEVWKMRDAYGTRLAVIAGFTYPGGLDPSVFLFDIDACGVVTIANAGVHDDVAQAAAAWRRYAGEPAAGTEPWPVTTADDLVCLVQADQDEMEVDGDESDSALDNWFRALRRGIDVADAWKRRGTPLPAWKSLYGDADPEPTVAAFTTWYTARHGEPPDVEAADLLAGEWLDGCLPEARHGASPHRVRYFREVMGDWTTDPVTADAKSLFPDWIRWNCEQAGVSDRLTAMSVAAAEAQSVQFHQDGSACAP